MASLNEIAAVVGISALVGLGGAAQRNLRNHDRQADHQRRQQIYQQEAGAAVGACQGGELPYIAEADGGAQCGGQDTKAGAEAAAFNRVAHCCFLSKSKVSIVANEKRGLTERMPPGIILSLR